MTPKPESAAAKPLIPPDLEQCQAEKPAASFMLLGHRSGTAFRVRCTEKPTYIATEKRKGPDGRRGSMSVCMSCASVMEKQRPGCATLKPIAEAIRSKPARTGRKGR